MPSDSHVYKYFTVVTSYFDLKHLNLTVDFTINVNDKYNLAYTFIKIIKAMKEMLSMGPPVYWVLGNDGDGILMNNSVDQNLVCGGPDCNNNSIVTKLYVASNYGET